MFTFQTFVHGKVGNESGPLSVTFDRTLAELQLLDRMFIEPDGSFVWAGVSAGGVTWQVDGNLIDRGDWLAYIELKGRCPETQFDEILAALGWPQANVVFELMRQGIVLDEPEFRRLAASQAGAV